MAQTPKPTLELEDMRLLVDDPLVLDDRDDADLVIPQLASQTFVSMARRLHDESRLELILPHATPDQLTSLLDLDAWRDDHIDVPRARLWLLAIADAYSGASKERGALAELIYAMDPEMWTLTLTPGTQVLVLDPNDDGSRDEAQDQLGHLRTYETPDGFFVVGVPDDDLGQMVLHTLHLVYADDLSEGRKLTLSIQAALFSELEEDCLRWRSGRLADLGFVRWEEAMKLFVGLERQAAAEQEPRDFAYLLSQADPEGAAVVVAWRRGPELMRRVMDRLPDAEHGVRAREFLLLVNEVMAAQRFPPGDDALQERAIDQTQSTISLGLELLGMTRLDSTASNPDASGSETTDDLESFLAERVTAIGLRDVFRVGYGALDRLRRAGLTLHKSFRVSLTAAGSLLDRPWGPAIASFVRWYPELPLEGTSARTRPIRSLADVATATRLVAEAGALANLAFHPDGYAVDPVWLSRVDEPERITLGDLIRTAIVHAHLPGSLTTLAPLTPDDVAWARNNLLGPGGRLVEPVRRDFSARCDELGIGEHTEVLAANLLTRLRAELAGLEFEGDQPDLSRTGGLLTIQQVGLWLQTRIGTGTDPN
jgi:hypothetical protein